MCLCNVWCGYAREMSTLFQGTEDFNYHRSTFIRYIMFNKQNLGKPNFAKTRSHKRIKQSKQRPNMKYHTKTVFVLAPKLFNKLPML